jgi:hypothetical protein
MKKLARAFVIVFLFYTEAYGQEVFFKTGKNFTTYEFKSGSGLDITFLPGRGDSYEFGLGFPFAEKEGTGPTVVSNDTSSPIWLKYEASLTLDSYDSYGGDLNNNYSWETTYGGVRNRLSILGKVGGLDLGLMGILGASKMITGTQVVNKSRFDLREFEDFSGVFIEGGLGGSASFQVVNQGFLSLSYDYSKSFRVGEQSPDRLRFNNQRIVFGIHFKLD